MAFSHIGMTYQVSNQEDTVDLIWWACPNHLYTSVWADQRDPLGGIENTRGMHGIVG